MDRDPNAIHNVIAVGFCNNLYTGTSGSAQEISEHRLASRMKMSFGAL